jgi:hypothetical protein
MSNEDAGIKLIRKSLSDLTKTHRDGQDELLKILIVVITVLISFISTSLSKVGLSCLQLILIKTSLVASTTCLFLSLYRIYYHQVKIPSQSLDHTLEIVLKCKSSEEALPLLQAGVSISNNYCYKHSNPVIVFSFCLSILSLVCSVLF